MTHPIRTLSLFVAILAARLPGLAAQESHDHCAPEPRPEAVVFHAAGRYSLPVAASPNDPAACVAATLATMPPLLHSRPFLVGVRVSGEQGYRLSAVRGGRLVLLDRDLVAFDALPSPAGSVAVELVDGRLVLMPESGAVRTLSARGHSPAWSHDGGRLWFMERAPQPNAPDRSVLRSFDLATATFRTVAEGAHDHFVAVSPDEYQLLFASGRTGLAAFFLCDLATGKTRQLCNFGRAITADFVPMPSAAPVWDQASRRVFYETDYGNGAQIWCLDLGADDTRILDAGQVALGTALTVLDGSLSYRAPDGALFTRSTAHVATTTRDLGLRKQDVGSIPCNTLGGAWDNGSLWSPLKVDWPQLYRPYRCSGDTGHTGHDYSAPRFTQLYAADNGNVATSVDGWGARGGEGNFIRIGHVSIGMWTEYWHLQPGSVWTPLPGTFVGVGMPVGRVGSTSVASGIAHVHFAVRQGLNPDRWENPTDYYAADRYASAPPKQGLRPSRYGSCDLVPLSVPSYDAPVPFDNDPPLIGDYRLIFVSRTSNSECFVHLECSIRDQSGVHDDPSWPTPMTPLARGVYCTLNPTYAIPPYQELTFPMSRIAGDEFSGRYRTDRPILVPFGLRAQGQSLFTLCVAAEDRALQGVAWNGIGNAGFAQFIVTDLDSQLYQNPSNETPDEVQVPLLDLGITIVEAPTRMAPGLASQVRVCVQNVDGRRRYPGGNTGTIALNPTLDEDSFAHVVLATFPIPGLAPQESVQIVVPFTTPSGLALMPQNLLAYAFASNDPDYINSGARVLVPVVRALPDLQVRGLNVAPEVGLGERFVFGAEIMNAGTAPAFGTFAIGTTLSVDPYLGGGDDIGMGLFWFSCPAGGLLPGQRVPISHLTHAVPGNALPNVQHFIVCADAGAPPCGAICELNELDNCAVASVAVVAPDVAIVAIQPPPGQPLVGGSGQQPYDVTIENLGRGFAAGNIRVTVAGNMNETEWGDVLFQLGPRERRVFTARVPTPRISSAPGQPIECGVAACHNYLDGTPANNCGNTTVRCTGPYWDLNVALEGAPAFVCVGGGTWINYSIRVTNTGNIASQNFRVVTAINRGAGQGNYCCVLQPQPAPIDSGGVPARGGFQVFPISYFIPGYSSRETQWLKAEIVWGDPLGSGNYAEQTIVIGC